MRLALALVAVIVGGCAVAAPATPPVPAAPTAATPTRSGGTLIVAAQEPSTLDPLYVAGVQAAATIYSVAVEGLVRAMPDGTFAPVLAREVPTLENGGVTLAADGMHVRYALRRGVTWSDGAPFSSADVRFTWERIMRDPRVATREGYDRISAIDTPDEDTVVVRYRQVYPAYLTRFDAVLPRHALDGVDPAAYGRAPLGTGPFRISEFVSAQQVTAVRNERFREPGRPLLDRVIFKFVPSIEAAMAQLRVGEVHAAFNVSEADALDLERDRAIVLDEARSPIIEALSFNVARRAAPADDSAPHPVLGDRTVRRALVHATPKAEIVRALLGGRAMVGRTEIPLGWAAVSDVDQEPYDPETARRLLADAGWSLGPDGIRRKGGVRAEVEIVSTTGNKLRERIQQVLIDAWRDVGVAATIRNVPSQVLTAPFAGGGTRRRGDFDVLLAQVGLGTIGGVDPQAYLTQRHTCAAIPRQANGGAGGNWERFCDRRIDTLLAQTATTLDMAQRRAAYREVQRIVNDEALAIWLFERSRINAFRTGVSGYAVNPWDVPTWNVAQWRMDTR